MKAGAVVFAVSSCALVCSVLAVNLDRAAYDVIVESHPFGAAPPKPSAEAVAAAAAAAAQVAPNPNLNFAVTFKLSFLRQDMASGDAVCGIDDTKNPAWHAYIGVGESLDGITVEEIDFDKYGVKLSKGDIQQWLYASGTATPDTAVSASVVPSQHHGSSVATGAVPSSGWKIRREPFRHNMVQPSTMSGAELEKHLEKLQMEIIRSGGEKGPPLPIPLTPDMDDQLVREGVLPPSN